MNSFSFVKKIMFHTAVFHQVHKPILTHFRINDPIHILKSMKPTF